MKHYGYVIASIYVALERQRVGWMYREAPTDEYDSGWRVFSGIEDEAFEDDPNNFGIYDAATIIAIDPDIEEYFLLAIGTEIERGPNGVLTVSKFGIKPKGDI